MVTIQTSGSSSSEKIQTGKSKHRNDSHTGESLILNTFSSDLCYLITQSLFLDLSRRPVSPLKRDGEQISNLYHAVNDVAMLSRSRLCSSTFRPRFGLASFRDSNCALSQKALKLFQRHRLFTVTLVWIKLVFSYLQFCHFFLLCSGTRITYFLIPIELKARDQHCQFRHGRDVPISLSFGVRLRL